MSSEKSREREVHRYYQPWLESTAAFDEFAYEDASDRVHLDGTSLRASNDKSLTAFAQLGCLRLNAKRALVTLIGTSRQYILAEATKSLSLISNQSSEGSDDEIWFGNASIPRSQDISEAALDPPIYTAVGQRGESFTGQALVINDLTQHERYSKYAFAGDGITFYSGVPIVSKAGYAIGVYTITDEKPRDGLTAIELSFMQDMSKIVMRHLETVKNDAARFRGERMVLGLSNFMRGRSSSTRYPQARPDLPSVSRDKSRLGQPVDASDIRRQFKGMAITNADPDILREIQVSDSSVKSGDHHDGSILPDKTKQSIPTDRPERLEDSSTEQNTEPEPEPEPENFSHDGALPPPQASKPLKKSEPSMSRKIEQVFSRAANILRECAAADGVIFYDAVPLLSATRSSTAESKAQENQIMENSGTSEDSASDSHEYSSSGPSTDSDGSIEEQSRILKTKGRKCDMLGYSLDISLHSTAKADTIKTLGLTERSLRHFLRRYPRGKAFYFDANGDTTISDAEISDHTHAKGINSATGKAPDAAIRAKAKAYSTKAIAEELIRVVPGARNVVWLPLWDFYKKRWSAGMFLWSRRTDRLLTAQDDMAYLKTFGNSIMIELSRTDAQFADEAKSTFIANISHELRSPLHGVLGSVEFLRETALDDFQSSMSLSIETCAKTLLDTVEHVLDYAKINHASAKFAKRSGSGASNLSATKHSLEIDLNLAELFEKTIEAVCAGSTFRGAQNPRTRTAIVGAHGLAENAMQMTQENIKNNSRKLTDAVRVVLNIEKRANWWVRTQPGAISRIILNMLGNALKYTEKGSIIVSLATSKAKFTDSSNRSVYMTVKDTGRGMSANFLRNHAFVPFNQESQFSDGVGLGLSNVRQIVQSLGGRVDLTSTQGVGTEIQVKMSLPVVAKSGPGHDTDSTLSAMMSKTPGMTICLLDPKLEKESLTEANAPDEAVQSSICDLAETWFGMKSLRARSMDGIVADFFFYAEPPSIDYLLHHHGEPSKNTEVPLIILTTNAFESASLTASGIHKLTDLGRLLEVISQPCGPHKLASTLQRCLTRLHTLTKNSTSDAAAEIVAPEVHESAEGLGAASTSPGLQAPDNEDSSVEHPKLPQAKLGRNPHSKDAVPQDKSDDPEHDNSEADLGATQALSPIVDSRALDLRSGLGADSESTTNNGGETHAPVLLVDDNEINLKLLVAFMKKARYPYVTAQDGSQAVQAYEKASADSKTAFKYVLMDISMPVMDGIEATRLVRRHEKKEGLQQTATIIALTGLSIESTRKDMMEAGADYFLSKPMKFKDLIQLMQS